MLEGDQVSLLHKPVWLDGWGDAVSTECFRTEEKVWKSFCREWKIMANRRPLGRAKWQLWFKAICKKWRPSICRAV